MNRRLLMDLVDEQRAQGSTVVMVTHQMDEVERLCDRILLLKDGRAEAYGRVADVQDAFGGRRMRLTFSGTLPASANYRVALSERNYAELELAGTAEVNAVVRELLDAGVQGGFSTARMSLEEIFLKVYGEQEAA
ncbi:MAG: hypothetical protein R2719_01735 [Micropruina sp.]